MLRVSIISGLPVGSFQSNVAAIDPDGRLSLAGLKNDLAFFKEQKLLSDPSMTVERIVDISVAQQAVAELGPYKPRGK